MSAAQGVSALRRFVQRRPQPERCDICSAAIPERHDHLLHRPDNSLLCACIACALLFDSGGSAYVRVPRDSWRLEGFGMSDGQWHSLGIPIGLAFLITGTGSVRACYPSPAGPAHAEADGEAWVSLLGDNPVLRTMRADVEALLVNRTQGLRTYYIAPLDRCFALTGLIRKHWRGFHGGDEAWEQIGSFFDELRLESRDGAERLCRI